MAQAVSSETQSFDPRIQIQEEAENYARVAIEPLKQGHGVTLGNALRRMLLSSLPGVAVTTVQVEGALHEFSTVPNIKEDVVEFILNVKRLRLRAFSDRPGRLVLDVAGRVGPVTAADIQAPQDYEIVNRGLHLATLNTPDGRLRVDFTVEPGYGYVPANHDDGLPIGVIPIDAIFTPVVKANYQVERAGAGYDSNQERLVLEVWTDGSITGIQAISRASEGLVDLFSHFTRLGKPAPTVVPHGLASGMAIAPKLYEMPIEDLNLSMRAQNCLKRSGIMTVGEILEQSEDTLLSLRNFGRKSYEEMRSRLIELGILKPEQMRSSEEAKEATGSVSEEPPSVLDEEETSVPPKGVVSGAPQSAQGGETEEEGGQKETLTDFQRKLLHLRQELEGEE